mmetsp:Transcript_30538/g.83900  ORF Transcript_30538/g.83900 Transcript_30538/m.83900 type:complete len:403 (+) Transcript_30538:843-2051(+)
MKLCGLTVRSLHSVDHFNPHLEATTIVTDMRGIEERPVLSWDPPPLVGELPIVGMPSVFQVHDCAPDELFGNDDVRVIVQVHLQSCIDGHVNVALLHSIKRRRVGVVLDHVPHRNADVLPERERQIWVREAASLAENANGLNEINPHSHAGRHVVFALVFPLEFGNIENVFVKVLFQTIRPAQFLQVGFTAVEHILFGYLRRRMPVRLVVHLVVHLGVLFPTICELDGVLEEAEAISVLVIPVHGCFLLFECVVIPQQRPVPEQEIGLEKVLLRRILQLARHHSVVHVLIFAAYLLAHARRETFNFAHVQLVLRLQRELFPLGVSFIVRRVLGPHLQRKCGRAYLVGLLCFRLDAIREVLALLLKTPLPVQPHLRRPFGLRLLYELVMCLRCLLCQSDLLPD